MHERKNTAALQEVNMFAEAHHCKLVLGFCEVQEPQPASFRHVAWLCSSPPRVSHGLIRLLHMLMRLAKRAIESYSSFDRQSVACQQA